ncbi:MULTISPECIES: hypothetical protein [unclassified Caballeronia]|uniref:hypothetical protein n=1 Tax=unclassified Caballeronia TaxID=2646786 RepID=UPI0028583937|nr:MULTISPECIES: hypothetical protein [unclassified Caballeronia]MDR5749189.1 hypothetical protein [Caballeronia sp. LZ024]MDR5843679.1 hypothetical protein [Caballeronia sp. LZ031]
MPSLFDPDPPQFLGKPTDLRSVGFFHGRGENYVGSNASHRGIVGASALPDGSPQRLLFCDPQGNARFDYTAIVRGNEWRLDMPFFIIDAIQAGRIQVRVAP